MPGCCAISRDKRFSHCWFDVDAVLLPPCLAFGRFLSNLVSVQCGHQLSPKRKCLLMCLEAPANRGKAQLLSGFQFLNERCVLRADDFNLLCYGRGVLSSGEALAFSREVGREVELKNEVRD